MKFMLVSVVGTRPNFIKLAPVDEAARRHKLKHLIIHTGQHYDFEMSKVFFEELAIPEPDFHLGVGSGSATKQITETIQKVAKTLDNLEQNLLVIIYGDCNATVGGAVASNKGGYVTAHVESGVRTGNRTFPEEINRILAETCSDVLFAPTKGVLRNIQHTGRAIFTGDVMYDTFLENQDKLDIQLLEKIPATSEDYHVLTMHRGMNVDDPKTFARILEAIASTKENFIFPAHPRAAKNLHLMDLPNNIHIIKPLSYLKFVSLVKYAQKIVTDSGGVQKEAYMLGVPCVTLIEDPVWFETIDAGWNIAVGSDPDRIREGILNFWPSGKRPQIFGTGKASEHIISVFIEKYPQLCSSDTI
ncbi:MAG: non-hydrolyzing UDP-N-acetylglucosamine 2-epimerase [Candidatus Hodarchaeota archaeon]